MDTEQSSEVDDRPGSERRVYRRFEVEEDASLLLVSHESWHPCKVVDLSLEGCQVSTGDKYQAGLQKRVEVKFKINGIVFRLSGTTQWTDNKHAVGIHFCYPTPRRKEELAEVLGEVEAAQAAKAQRDAEEALAKQLAEDETPVVEEPGEVEDADIGPHRVTGRGVR